MDLKIPYVAVKNSQEAFGVVKNFLQNDGLSMLPVKPSFQFMPEKNLIIAEGSGFKIRALFEPEFVAISIDLSFLYRAFKGKVTEILEQHLKKKL
jgi:hypothetical protein